MGWSLRYSRRAFKSLRTGADAHSNWVTGTLLAVAAVNRSGFLRKNFVIWSENGRSASVCPDTFLATEQATTPCPVVRSQQGNAIMTKGCSLPAHFASYPKVSLDLYFTVHQRKVWFHP